MRAAAAHVELFHVRDDLVAHVVPQIHLSVAVSAWPRVGRSLAPAAPVQYHVRRAIGDELPHDALGLNLQVRMESGTHCRTAPHSACGVVMFMDIRRIMDISFCGDGICERATDQRRARRSSSAGTWSSEITSRSHLNSSSAPAGCARAMSEAGLLASGQRHASSSGSAPCANKGQGQRRCDRHGRTKRARAFAAPDGRVATPVPACRTGDSRWRTRAPGASRTSAWPAIGAMSTTAGAEERRGGAGRGEALPASC